MTSSWMKPAIFRLVAYCLKKLRYSVPAPHKVRYFLKILVKSVRIMKTVSDFHPQKWQWCLIYICEIASVTWGRKRVSRTSKTSKSAKMFLNVPLRFRNDNLIRCGSDKASKPVVWITKGHRRSAGHLIRLPQIAALREAYSGTGRTSSCNMNDARIWGSWYCHV
jgi:hypothetical protein